MSLNVYGVHHFRVHVYNSTRFTPLHDSVHEYGRGTTTVGADDTKIFKEIRSSIDCNQLQADLNKLVLWTRKWQMETYPGACIRPILLTYNYK